MAASGPSAAELAGGLRTAVVRLHYWLQAPVARRGVTPTRLTAMAILEKTGPLRAGDLADRLTITAPSMSRLAESLEEGGWVRREPDPEDRRAQLIALSDDGRATLDVLRREGTGELADALGSLPRADREALERALPVLVRLSDVMGEPRHEGASAGRHG